MAYRILITDDDIPMLEWLKGLNWGRMQCKVIAACVNGQQALQKAIKLRAQIVLADIAMPMMNGLELTHALKQEDPRIQVILLSSYQKFEYAHDAMQMDVRCYLIKGLFDEDELFRAVQAAIDNYEHTVDQTEYKELDYPAAVALASCFNNEEEAFQILRREMDSGVSFLPARLPNQMKIMMPGADNTRFMSSVNKLFATYMNLFLRNRIWIVLGDLVVDKKSYEMQRERLEQTLFFTNTPNKIIPISDHCQCISQIKSDKLLYQLIEKRKNNTLISYLQTAAEDEICQAEMHPADVRLSFVKWASEFGFPNQETILAKYAQAATLKELLENTIALLIQMNKTDVLPPVMQDVLRFIRENSQRELTLREVAFKTGYSPNYLGNLFKKHMGTNFRNYLTHLRLTRARSYLLGSALPASEIARMVGISDYRYFARLYREQYGVNPSSSRRHIP